MGQQHATPSSARIPVSDRAVTPPVLPSSIAIHQLDRSDSAEHEEPESVPVMFKWTHGGQRVYLTGSFNDWASEGIPMVRSGQEFYQVIQVPKGVHEYKFLVDGEWKFSLDQPVLQDVSGNVNNVVDIQHYERYEPAALKDPLDVEEAETEWGQEIQDALQTEPPTAPPLLVKLPLLNLPNHRKAELSRQLHSSSSAPSLSAPTPTPPSVNIPLFSICGHIVHDASASFRGVGSDSVVSVSTERFAQKYATTILLTQNNSARSDGLLRHYGLIPADDPATPTAMHVFHKALLGRKVPRPAAGPPGSDPAGGILKRANSNGSEGVRTRTLDLSTFTD